MYIQRSHIDMRIPKAGKMKWVSNSELRRRVGAWDLRGKGCISQCDKRSSGLPCRIHGSLSSNLPRLLIFTPGKTLSLDSCVVKGGTEVFLEPAGCQGPSAQNNPCVRVAHFGRGWGGSVPNPFNPYIQVKYTLATTHLWLPWTLYVPFSVASFLAVALGDFVIPEELSRLSCPYLPEPGFHECSLLLS